MLAVLFILNSSSDLFTALVSLSLCLSDRSDLDRDFWNNNDSSNVQQRWSSYPPKEFLLNMSPYAPYGDPRLTPKWVSVMAGKETLCLCRAAVRTFLNPSEPPPQKESRRLVNMIRVFIPNYDVMSLVFMKLWGFSAMCFFLIFQFL